MMVGGNVISIKVRVSAIARGAQRVSLLMEPVDAIVQGEPSVFDFTFIVLFWGFFSGGGVLSPSLVGAGVVFPLAKSA